MRVYCHHNIRIDASQMRCTATAMMAMMVLVGVTLTIDIIPASYAQTDYPHLGVRVETVADGLQIPWSVDWLSDGTMIFTERGGNLYELKTGASDPVVIHTFASAGSQEAGLLGVAVDPDFERNGFVYVYYTYQKLFETHNKIERYRYVPNPAGDGAGKLQEGHVILDGIPASPWHDGGRIGFGPDGMLYAATGDAIKPGLSQDTNSLAGKILRMNPDGTIPDDNPYPGLYVYSMGHRNPQGMDWTTDHTMIITEHGPSGTPVPFVGHDEINIVTPGGNYGWPVIIGSADDDDNDNDNTFYLNPAYHTGHKTWAPSGAEFYESDAIPEWHGRYFVATLRGQSMQMLQVDSAAGRVAGVPVALFEGDFGRLRDVQTGPDGYLYLLTSNRDGRGSPAINDDRILRVTPLYEPAIESADIQGMQRLATIAYDGPETGKTGMLHAMLRHPGYDVSDFVFALSQKSIEFDFERAKAADNTYADASLSIFVERPLLSAPFEVVIYDESGAIHASSMMTNGNGDSNGIDENRAGPRVLAIRDAPDHYVITIDAGVLDAGRVVVTAAHVIPEFEHVLLLVLAASASFIVLAGRMLRKKDLAVKNESCSLCIVQA